MPVTTVSGVGPVVAKALAKLGIPTVADLITHYPFRYLNPADLIKLGDVREGQEVVVRGEVVEVDKRYIPKRKLSIVTVGIYDGTGYLYGTWFNRDYIADYLKAGVTVSFRGRVEFKYGKLQIANPLFDVLSEAGKEAVHSRSIVAIHAATEGLSATRLRRLIKAALDACPPLPEVLPAGIVRAHRLVARDSAVREVHLPTGLRMLKASRRRLIFEELFVLQAGLALRKARRQRVVGGIAHPPPGRLHVGFLAALPFKPTGDQLRAIKEIDADMARTYPMHRLLLGDVGSGKTLVSVAAALTAIEGGHQAAIMAPTEVLAVQHYRSILRLVEGLTVNVLLLTGADRAAEGKAKLGEIASGEAQLVVGTHALIQEQVRFKSLGLAVVDEQHRFGVRQRVLLKEKGAFPDVLVATATPIPRTLALTLYGDLDVSYLREMPGGRNRLERVKTFVCDESLRERAYEKIREEIAEGRQAFIVCPVIHESDKLEVKAALAEADRLRREVFTDLRLGLLHGRLGSEEKTREMGRFAAGELDVLISTSVVEVGVDVPNASVILVEDAERFGLAQLHQLRGRIGRGRWPGWCILFAEAGTEEGRQRMEAIRTIQDGFELAEADLAIRGEGQLFGARQSGLPDLKMARLTRDIEVLKEARRAAFELVEGDPDLRRSDNAALGCEVKDRFGAALDWLFEG